MRFGSFALALLLSLVTLAGLQPIGAQQVARSCPFPPPRPGEGSAFAPSRIGPGEGADRPPPYFVSSSGNLCQRLDLEAPLGPDPQAVGRRPPEPGKAFLLSALLPGAGQRLLGQDRWTAYAAAEIWAWIQFLDKRREGKKLQRRYQDLAWYVARRISSGVRTDAGWDYYEALTQYESSGVYDRDPQEPGVQPETDPSTYNGRIWTLAQEIYLPEDPEIPADEGSKAYMEAVQYYLSRAYKPDLAWNWGANSLHRKEYIDLIRASDENLRHSTTMIGVILANHLLSAVDALVSGRLRMVPPEEPRVAVLLQPGPVGLGQVALQLRLPLPNVRAH